MSDENDETMAQSAKTKLVVCWHMHQPNYIDAATQTYILPWTYLHAIKDYVDMAAHLEATPEACAVVNFAPVLLEQLDDYAKKIEQWKLNGSIISDPMLDALASDNVHACFMRTPVLLTDCLRANEDRLVNRYPHFSKLFNIAKQFSDESDLSFYLSEQFVCDLLVWYNLAWVAETEKRNNAFIQSLIKKEKRFSIEDRRSLVNYIGELVASVVPRYRKLAEQDRVELAFSPYAHPIMPLLIDLNSAKQATPDIPMPETQNYPDGHSRAKWHIEKGIAVFESYFGFKPTGCWPSEGGVCDETIKMCSDFGISWVASGESVLRNSLGQEDLIDNACLHRAYQLNDHNIKCYFRDDGLSDLIGFDYSTWHGDDAINNLVHHIENISQSCDDKKDVVISIIMDGENAWEYYPENGYYFLSEFYKKLSNNDVFELTTYSKIQSENIKTWSLDHIVAGSWVYGSFSTWIGDKDKNLGWDLLCQAKMDFDRVLKQATLSEDAKEAATQQLAICEGSDWFWWFGDYNSSASVSDFDRLYRTHLRQLYLLLGEDVPRSLSNVISIGGGNPAVGGVMRHGSDQSG